MDTSVTIIGVIFLALIGIPLYFVMRGQSINNKKVKTILSGYGHYLFNISEKQNRKVLLLDSEKKAFLSIDFNHKPETVTFVNLKEYDSVALEINKIGSNNSISTIALSFLKQNNTQKKKVVCYDSENDPNLMLLNEDLEMSKKWQTILSDSLKS